MSAAAAASPGGGAPAAVPAPQLAATLSDELKAQFRQELALTAVRVPKQDTHKYMQLLSK